MRERSLAVIDVVLVDEVTAVKPGSLLLVRPIAKASKLVKSVTGMNLLPTIESCCRYLEPDSRNFLHSYIQIHNA